MRRIVIAEVPIGGAFWSGVGPVGVVRFFERDAGMVAVAVRLRTALAMDGQRVQPGAPEDLIGSRGRARTDQRPLGPHELVPGKRGCDVAIVGRLARGTVPPDEAVPLHVELGGEVRTVSLVDARDVIDAASTTVVTSDASAAWLAPRLPRLLGDLGRVASEADLDDFHHAPEALRFARPRLGSDLVIRTERDVVRVQLGFGVHLRVDFADDDTAAFPQARCDGIVVRLDEGAIDWVFRAVVRDPSLGREIERVCFAVTPDDGDVADIDRWAAHGRFGVAMDPEDAVRGTAAPRLADEQLLVARYSTWDLGPTQPALPIEEVAEIQVELERGDRPRAAVLEEHELDEYEWSLEERTLGERLLEDGAESAANSSEAGDDDGDGGSRDERTPAARYTNALDAARRRGERPPLPAASRWAKVRAALEVRDPVRLLADERLTVAAFVATDRAFETALDEDDARRADFEDHLDRARAEERRLAATAGEVTTDDDDDDAEDEEAP